ncbi:MAG TPA: hypothetical protein VEF03_02735 [Candidatus Binataceae bacterium]|nr:hypothetical protein [Candidatus Binataceae bacterium]
MNVLRLSLFAVASWAILAMLAPHISLASENLLVNGDFASGAESSPAAWTPESWVSSPDTHYRWIAPLRDHPGELEIETAGMVNDARWVQTVHLDPGWYHIHAEARSENVGAGPGLAGAAIGILEFGTRFDQIKGDSDWTELGFYLNVAEPADVRVVLRLGEPWQYNTGRAFFRNAAIERVDGPVAGAQIWNLSEARSIWSGNRLSIVPVFVLLGVAAAIGWRLCKTL